jgi:hypothetical protein
MPLMRVLSAGGRQRNHLIFAFCECEPYSSDVDCRVDDTKAMRLLEYLEC